MSMAGLFLAAVLQAAAAHAQPPGRNLTYLALGDSITWGCGSHAAPEGPWSGTFCGAGAERMQAVVSKSQDRGIGWLLTLDGRTNYGSPHVLQWWAEEVRAVARHAV